MNSESKKINRGVSRGFLFFLRVTPCPLWLIFFFLFFTIASCSAQKLAVMEIPIEREGLEVAVIKAEIARTQEERTRGLMFRNKLPDGEGMFFVFESDEVLSFWMKNTYVPLSIAYIASDGRIIEIKDMYPHDLNSVFSSRAVRYALEVPQGWFSRAGVKSGDVVNIDLALKNSRK
jgi:uncharacterized membrane protein (UPF0127 family)